MSFIKKGIKKVWKFVKDNWKMIALAAAVVFTAGVATVGFGAFAAAGFGSSSAAAAATAASAASVAAGGAATAGTFGSFMGAVGSTMWAGVAGAAGSAGLGPGAVAPAGSAAATAGASHVGLGAAWGAGANVGGVSVGWGKAGATAGQQIAAQSAGGAITAPGSVIGGSTLNPVTPTMPGAPGAAPTPLAGSGTMPGTSTPFTPGAAPGTPMTSHGAEVFEQVAKKAADEGMTTAQATLISTGVAAAGQGLSALAGKDSGDEGGAAVWGSYAGGAKQEAKGRAEDAAAAEKANEFLTPEGGLMAGGGDSAAYGAGSGTGVANYMRDEQMARASSSATAPLMGGGAPRGMDGRILTQEDIDEMERNRITGTYGGYGYA